MACPIVFRRLQHKPQALSGGEQQRVAIPHQAAFVARPAGDTGIDLRSLRQRKCDQSDGTFLIRIGRFIIAARIARCTEQQVLTAIKFVRRR